MVPRPLSLLELLPTELLPKVLLPLDSHSLLSVLKAHPGLSNECVLIAEEAHFFKCPSLKVVSPREFKPSRYLLKIYEVSVPISFKPTYSLDIPCAKPSDSFIHCFLSTGKFDQLRTSFFREVFKSKLFDCGITFQLDEFRTDKVIMYNHLNLSAVQVYEDLTHVDLQNISHLENVIFASGLSYLSISFIGSRPTMKNISAFYLTFLAIYYQDVPPIFGKLELTSQYNLPDFHRKVLKVCHTPSNTKLTSPLPVPSYPTDSVDFSPLVSSNAFGKIIIVGGHDCIVQQLTSGPIQILTWKQTCFQSHPLTSVKVTKARLFDVSFETLLPNATIPQFQVTVEKLHITTHNGAEFQKQHNPLLDEMDIGEVYHMIDIHGFYKKWHVDCVGYGYYDSLMIHCKLPKSNQFPFELNTPNLEDIPAINLPNRIRVYLQGSFEGVRESKAIRHGVVPRINFHLNNCPVKHKYAYWKVQKSTL